VLAAFEEKRALMISRGGGVSHGSVNLKPHERRGMNDWGSNVFEF